MSAHSLNEFICGVGEGILANVRLLSYVLEDLFISSYNIKYSCFFDLLTLEVLFFLRSVTERQAVLTKGT